MDVKYSDPEKIFELIREMDENDCNLTDVEDASDYEHDTDDSDQDPDYLPTEEEDLDEIMQQKIKVSESQNPLGATCAIPPDPKNNAVNESAGQEIRSERGPPPLKRKREEKQTTANKILSHIIQPNDEIILSKNNYEWHTTPRLSTGKTLSRNIVHIRPGPVGDARDVLDPIDCFRLFFSRDMVQGIVEHTNTEILVTRENYSRVEGTIDQTNIEELECLLGTLYLAAALKNNHLSANLIFNSEYCGSKFRAAMSCRRFQFLINCLRFDDKKTREERKTNDRLAAIRDLWSKLVSNCREKYRPSSYVTIDEQLVAFRGRCPFKMYIPSKPAKYGLKIVLMCDAGSRYMVDAIPYLGKGTVPANISAGSFFVKELTKSIKGSNRNVTMDNWFTNIPLISDLLNQDHLTVIGTIKKNKKELPTEITDIKYNNRKVESSFFLFNNDITAVSYKASSTKLVVLVSSVHKNISVNPHSKKPEIIMSYNDTKYGVDVFDQMCRNMDTGRKTRRWPLSFFYNMLNIAAINGYVIYLHNFYRQPKNNGKKPLSRIAFMQKLSEQLCEPWMRKRLLIPGISRELRSVIHSATGTVETPDPFVLGEKSKGPRKYCSYCNYKKKKMTTTYCSKCNKPICGDHQTKICYPPC